MREWFTREPKLPRDHELFIEPIQFVWEMIRKMSSFQSIKAWALRSSMPMNILIPLAAVIAYYATRRCFLSLLTNFPESMMLKIM